MRSVALAAALALLAAAPAAAQHPAVFGVVDPDAFIQGNATRFIGCHDGRRFVLAPCRVDAIVPGAVLPALDSLGRTSRVVIQQVFPLRGDLYEAPYAAHVSLAEGGDADVPLLFWTPGAAVQVLPPHPVELAPAVLDELRRRADSLAARAADARPDDERPLSITHGPAQAWAVEGESDRVVVHWTAELVYGPELVDRRASFTFVWAPGARRVVFATFGHPEWAPVAADLVLAVKPLLFFRVGMGDRVYFLARRDGAWESIGFGIFDLRTGETVVQSL